MRAAIRDPLSGRSYVYQAMRITGAGDPHTPLEETLPGKLPQRKIIRTATAGQVHVVPISDGEGRFYASREQVQQLLANVQVVFQYAYIYGRPASSMTWNPKGSVCAIEGITSSDGCLLGKIGHSERSLTPNISINIPGEKTRASSPPASNISAENKQMFVRIRQDFGVNQHWRLSSLTFLFRRLCMSFTHR